MTVFYCDYDQGNDSADGLTFETRWKTLTLGATAARIAPGDEIRIKASPDATSLGQTATWTDGPLPATFVPTSSTNTSPIVFTKADHGLVTGDTVIVQAHTTNTNANGVWDVTVDGDTFTLLNADGSNSVGNGTGGATGTVRKITNSVVKLATPVTQNIACFGNQNSAGKAAWTPSANVTSTISATEYKEGYGGQTIAIAAGFTTGLAAYFPTGLLDLSAYQQVSFWIKQTAGVVGLANSLSLVLCSDTAGTVVVDTVNIPLRGGNFWFHNITVDLGHALGSAIQSIGFVVNTDNGAQTFIIDSIIACKASSAADALSQLSLLGKNTGTEGWYGIQSINGTRVILDGTVNVVPKTAPARGYSGTTETIETYKRETTKTVMAASSSTAVQALQDSGVEGNPITFSGGWNRTDMSTQTGLTYFDGQNGQGYGIDSNSKSFVALSKLAAFRYFSGFMVSGSGTNYSISTPDVNNNFNGIDTNTGNFRGSFTVDNANNNSAGFILTYSRFSTINVINCCNNLNGGGAIILGVNSYVKVDNLRNNAIGIVPDDKSTIVINDNGNSTDDVHIGGAGTVNYLVNSYLNSSVKVAGFVNNSNAFIWSTNENGDTDTHFGYTDGGLISSDIATVHTVGGMSWKLSPTSTTRSASYPLPLKVAVGATAANIPITCKVWFRRDNIGLTARLICKGGQLLGVDNDVMTYMTAAADVWEELSLVVTPTQKGVLEFTAECWGGTIYNCWTSDPSFA